MSEINYTVRALKEIKTMVKRKDFGFTRALDEAIKAVEEKEIANLTPEQITELQAENEQLKKAYKLACTYLPRSVMEQEEWEDFFVQRAKEQQLS